MFEMTTCLCCRDDCCCTRTQRMRVNLLNRLADNWRNCEDIVRTFDFDALSVLRLRSQYEYVTSSHLIVALNQTSLLDSFNNSSINRISRFIDHAQILSERTEKWTRDFKRKFYWTIHEEIHFMIFTSRFENDIKTTNKWIEIDIEVFYLVNRKI
jgi:hypothetical protein